MVFSDIEQKERVVLFASIFLLVAIFGYSIYYYYNPPIRVLEAKVFEVIHKEDATVLWTYGHGKIILKGNHDIEIDEVYRITYRGRRPTYTDVLISIEKIG